MYNISKSFEFDASHRLMKHSGQCSNIHGHRYKLVVDLSCSELDGGDMVLDFINLNFVKEYINRNWDHGILLNSEDEDVIAFMLLHDFRYWTFNSDPTAEAIAREIYDMVGEGIKKIDAFRIITVSCVTVWETPNCKASYSK